MPPTHAGPPDSDRSETASTPVELPKASRWGLLLFFVYLAIYVGFVLLSAFAPEAMEREAFSGVNLAVTYGVGLIVAALVMAIAYGYMSRVRTAPSGERGRP